MASWWKGVVRLLYWKHVVDTFCRFRKRWLVWLVYGVNTTSNDMSVISWRSVLLVEETGVPGENHRHVASHWQTLLHNVVSSTPRFELTTLLVIGTDCTCSCKSNYHTIKTTTAPKKIYTNVYKTVLLEKSICIQTNTITFCEKYKGVKQYWWFFCA